MREGQGEIVSPTLRDAKDGAPGGLTDRFAMLALALASGRRLWHGFGWLLFFWLPFVFVSHERSLPAPGTIETRVAHLPTA